MRKDFFYTNTSVVAVLLLCLQAGIPKATAGDADSHEFPGKGNRAAWDEANAYYIQGVQATQSGKVELSVVAYKKAISIYPDDPDFQINLGVALEDKGSFKEAETVLLKALTMVPQNWTVSYNLGNVMYAEHKYQDAVNYWSKAMTLNPPEHFRKKSESNIALVTKQFLSKQHK